MICKHIDLIAIALLLAAVGFFSHTQQAVLARIHRPILVRGFQHYRSYVTTQLPCIRFSLD